MSQDPLKQTLGQLRNRMVVFSFMVLTLTVGVVCSLIYRQVLLPIKHLVAFTKEPVGGNFKNNFPEINGEISELAEAFQKMNDRVRDLEHQHSADKKNNIFTRSPSLMFFRCFWMFCSDSVLSILSWQAKRG